MESKDVTMAWSPFVCLSVTLAHFAKAIGHLAEILISLKYDCIGQGSWCPQKKTLSVITPYL